MSKAYFQVNADGTWNGWTPSSGTDHFAMVDDGTEYTSGVPTADDSTTTLAKGGFPTSPPGSSEIEEFTLDSSTVNSVIGASDTINYVTIHYRWNGSSSFGLKANCLHSGTRVLGTEYVGTGVYVNHSHQYDDCPGQTGWTRSQLTAAEFGIAYTKGFFGACYLTLVYVEVDYTAASSNFPAPTVLKVENSTSNITDSSDRPAFSAQNNASTETMDSFQIEVHDNSSFTSLKFDSGWLTFASQNLNNVTAGSQCDPIRYNPSTWTTNDYFLNGSTYYWRIKFRDSLLVESLWSTLTIPNFTGWTRSWKDADYNFRRKLTFDSDHEALPISHLAKFNMQTGNRHIIATDGAFNGSVAAVGDFLDSYQGKTHQVYLGNYDEYGELATMIRTLDESTGTWGESVRISGANTTDDQHNFPNITIDKQGYIHVFFGCHYSDLLYRRSRYPNISGSLPGEVVEWIDPTQLPTISYTDYVIPGSTNNATYPAALTIEDGRVYVFFRYGGIDAHHYKFSYSVDNGKSWLSALTFMQDTYYVDFARTYYRVYAQQMRYDPVRNRLHVGYSFNRKDINPSSDNVGSTVFTGSGLDDCVSSGLYTYQLDETYYVEIETTSTSPDRYKWKKGLLGDWTTKNNCSLTPVEMSNGVSVAFGAVDGHTVGDYWTIDVTDTRSIDVEKGMWYVYSDYDDTDAFSTTTLGFNIFKFANGNVAGYTTNSPVDYVHSGYGNIIAYDETKAIALSVDRMNQVFGLAIGITFTGDPIIFWSEGFKFWEFSNQYEVYNERYVSSAVYKDVIDSAVMSVGSGLDDLQTTGDYTGSTSDTWTIKVTSSISSPDLFQWKKGSGSWSSNVNMSTTAIDLQEGVQVFFGATNGHTLNDEWTFNVSTEQWHESNVSTDHNIMLITRHTGLGLGTDKDGKFHFLMPTLAKQYHHCIPDADSASSGVTRKSELSNYLEVDDPSHYCDGENSYLDIAGSTGYVELTSTETVPTNVTLLSVEIVAVLRKVTAGDPTISAQLFIDIGGVDYNSSSISITWDIEAGGNNYWQEESKISNEWTQDPSTSAAWTEANVNAAKFGVKNLTASSNLRVSKLLKRIRYTKATDEKQFASEIYEFISEDHGLTWVSKELTRNTQYGLPVFNDKNSSLDGVIKVCWGQGSDIFYWTNEPYARMQFTAQDLRLYWGDTEIDRILNYTDLDSTEIRFAMQEALSTSAVEGTRDLYIYYGNSDVVSNPLADPAQVYTLFFDNFETYADGASLVASSTWTLGGGSTKEGYIYGSPPNIFNKVAAGQMSVGGESAGLDIDHAITSSSHVLLEAFLWREVDSVGDTYIELSTGSSEWRAGLDNTQHKPFLKRLSASKDYGGDRYAIAKNYYKFGIQLNSGECAAWFNNSVIARNLLANNPVTRLTIRSDVMSYADYVTASVWYPDREIMTQLNPGDLTDQYISYDTAHTFVRTTEDAYHNFGSGNQLIRKIEVRVRARVNDFWFGTSTHYFHAWVCYDGIYNSTTDKTEVDTTFSFNSTDSNWAEYTVTLDGLFDGEKSIKIDYYLESGYGIPANLQAEVLWIKKYTRQDPLLIDVGTEETHGLVCVSAVEGKGSTQFSVISKVEGWLRGIVTPIDIEYHAGLNILVPVDVEYTSDRNIVSEHFVEWIGIASITHKLSVEYGSGRNMIVEFPSSYKAVIIYAYPISVEYGSGRNMIVEFPIEYVAKVAHIHEFWFEYELVDRHVVSMNVEYGLQADIVIEISAEYLAILNSLSELPVEYTSDFSDLYSFPVGYQGGSYSIVDVPVSYSGSLNFVAELPIDYVLDRSIISEIPISYGLSTTIIYDIPVAYTGSINVVAGIIIEYTSWLNVVDEFSIEYVSLKSSVYKLMVEYDLGTNLVHNIPIEYGGPIAIITSISIEYTSWLNTVHVLSVEHGLGTYSIYKFDIEYGLALSIIHEFPITYLGSFSEMGVIPIEYSGMAAVYVASLAIEYLGSFSEVQSFNINYVADINYIAGTPVEYTVAGSYIRHIPVSWIMNRSVLIELPVGYTGGLLQSYKIPIEYMGSRAVVCEISIAYRGSLSYTLSWPVEYVESRETVQQIPVEYSIAISSIITAFPLSYGQSVSYVPGVNIEYSGLSVIAVVGIAIEYSSLFYSIQEILVEYNAVSNITTQLSIEYMSIFALITDIWAEYLSQRVKTYQIPVEYLLSAIPVVVDVPIEYNSVISSVISNISVEYMGSFAEIMQVPIEYTSGLQFSEISKFFIEWKSSYSEIYPINIETLVDAYRVGAFPIDITKHKEGVYAWPIEITSAVSIIGLFDLPIEYRGSFKEVRPFSIEYGLNIESTLSSVIEWTMSRVIRDYFAVEYGVTFAQVAQIVTEYLGSRNLKTRIDIEWKATQSFVATVNVEYLQKTVALFNFDIEYLLGVVLKFQVPVSWLGTVIAALVIHNVALKVASVTDPSISKAELASLLMKVASANSLSMKKSSAEELALIVITILQEDLLGGTSDAS